MACPPAERGFLAGVQLASFVIMVSATTVFLQQGWPRPGELAALTVAGGLVAIVQVWLAGRCLGPARWLGLGGAIVGAWLLIRLLARADWTSISPAQSAYVLVAGAALGVGFQALVKAQSDRAGIGRWPEAMRLASLLALAVWLFRPFLTASFFGGIDGRWYAYAMVDALQQARAGVFPVLVGQSEFMSDGSINPIRLAPYYQNFGIVLDGLTARVLAPTAVQHLTVLVTAMLSAGVCYLCLTALEPARRWLAWVLSALYVSVPAAAAFIYLQEMQMTFLAFAWLPLVMFGNVRLIRRDSPAGWGWLASGLALVWFCHAPIGAWVTLCTLSVQGLRLLTRDTSGTAWWRAAGGCLLFGGLSIWYFWPIAELSQAVAGGSTRSVLVYGLALAVGLVAVIRYLATGRWPWLGLAALATVILWFTSRQYAYWLGASLLLAIGLTWAGLRWPVLRVRERLPEWVVAGLLFGGMLSLPFGLPSGQIPALAVVQRLFPASLQPALGAGRGLSEIQIGYGLWAALLCGLIAALIRPTWENRLFSLMGLVLLALALPVPGVTRFLLGAVPEPLINISSTVLWVRYLPLLAVVAVFLGFMAGAAWLGQSPRGSIGLVVLACLALGWSLHESEKFVRHGYRPINSPEEVKAFYRPETIRLYSFILPNMPASPYMTNGVVDYLLESRLLRADDPTMEARPQLEWANARTVTLTTKIDAQTPGRMELEPKLTLAPGERLLLRFEFFAKPYAGRLICQGPNGFYREYFLPEAGFFAKSFGVAPGRPKTIALWNTSEQPQPVELIYLCDELPADGRPFGDFAKVTMQTYTAEQLAVNTLGLIPYRARVRTEEPVYLETPRAFVPGYRATVNNAPVPVIRSPNHRAMIKLPAGNDLVQLRYTGTPALWLAFGTSALSWCGLLVVGIRRLRSQPILPTGQA
jgi:hypothetical protein